MFKQMKNIDSAFRYIRAASLLAIIGCTALSGFVILQSYSLAKSTQSKVYVLANGKVLEAYSSERSENVPIEAKDHIKMFHFYFFTLSPDDKAIQENITKALYLADGTAKTQYDNLSENNYYGNIISGNISQTIRVDSVFLDTNQYPYFFRCYAKQELTRPTSVVIRSLITEGYLRNTIRSENNSHGLLIERWVTVENKDISVKNR